MLVQLDMKNGSALGQSLADYLGCPLLVFVSSPSLIPRGSAIFRLSTMSTASQSNDRNEKKKKKRKRDVPYVYAVGRTPDVNVQNAKPQLPNGNCMITSVV